MQDAKILFVIYDRNFTDVDGQHPSSERPSVQPRLHLGDISDLALKLDLDRSVSKIAHPAGKPQRSRALSRAPAKADALDTPLHDRVPTH